jgi:hypothetical protein
MLPESDGRKWGWKNSLRERRLSQNERYSPEIFSTTTETCENRFPVFGSKRVVGGLHPKKTDNKQSPFPSIHPFIHSFIHSKVIQTIDPSILWNEN